MSQSQGKLSFNQPPLNMIDDPPPGLSRSDLSLMVCASKLGGAVLTNDRALQKKLASEAVSCIKFQDFLNLSEQNKWLSSSKVMILRSMSAP